MNDTKSICVVKIMRGAILFAAFFRGNTGFTVMSIIHLLVIRDAEPVGVIGVHCGRRLLPDRSRGTGG